MRARPNGWAVMILWTGTEGWDWQEGPRNFSTGKPGQSGARMMCTPLGWQHPTQVSASCLGAGTSGFWLNSLQGKQLHLLVPAHLDAIFKSLIYMPSAAAARHSRAAPLGGDSKCQISWKGAHSPAGESQPHTFGTPALDELGGRRITVLGPKGLRQECQSFIYFLKSVEFGVKKKKSKLLCKGMDNQAGLHFSVAQGFHLNDDE